MKPIINLASAAIMAASPVSVSTRSVETQFNEFFQKINSADLSTKVSEEIILKFKNSQFYKAKSNWEKMSELEIENTISELFTSSEFTDSEKVEIGKLIIQNYSYEHFFESIGLDPKITTTREAQSQTSDLIQGFNNNVRAITYDANGMPSFSNIFSKGKSGLFVEYTNQNRFDDVYVLSTKTIVKNFFAILTSLDTFDNTIEFYKGLDERLGEEKDAFAVAVNHLSVTMNSLFSEIGISQQLKTDLENFDIFNALLKEHAGGDAGVYKSVMTSGLGILFDNNAPANSVYPTSPRGIIRAQGEVLLGIYNSLVGAKNTYSKNESLKFLNDNFPNRINERAEKINLLKLYAGLLGETKKLTQEVSIRVNGGLIENHLVQLQSGHSNSEDPAHNWNPLNIQLSSLLVSRSLTYDFSLKNVYANSQPIAPPKQIFQGDLVTFRMSTPFRNTLRVHNLDDNFNWVPSHTLNALVADLKDVMPSGTDAWFYMALKRYVEHPGDPNHQSDEWGAILLHENDNDHDVDVKQSDFMTRPLNPDHVIFSSVDIPEFLGNFVLEFSWVVNGKIGPVVSSTTFSDLDKQVAELYHQVRSRAETMIRQYKDQSWANLFEQNANQVIHIQIESIDLGEVRFNTYNDPGWDSTHSNWFNFRGGRVNWKVWITQQPR